MSDLEAIIDGLLDSITPDEIKDDTLLALHLVFSHLLVGALDLIDKGNVTRWSTSWGRIFYTVSGTTDTYSVILDIYAASPGSQNSRKFQLPPPQSRFCSCPAFAFKSLRPPIHHFDFLSPSSPPDMCPQMCKHILAVRLAERLDKFTERSLGEENMEAFVALSVGKHRDA